MNVCLVVKKLLNTGALHIFLLTANTVYLQYYCKIPLECHASGQINEKGVVTSYLS